MSREEFMNQLAYMLQDLPEEERQEALQYYEDYFDDAGAEQEPWVITELGSPERVAATIRADLNGSAKDSGEFTEKGYTDPRFDQPKKEVASQGESTQAEPKYWTNNTLKTVLYIILIISAVKWIPRIMGLGGQLASFLMGTLGVLLSITLLAGLTAALLFLAAAGLIFTGIIQLTMVPLQGIMLLGGGVIVLGIGFLMVGFAICFYGKFLPFLMRSISGAISGLRNRNHRGMRG